MELISKIIKFELSNAFRSKWILVYSLFFFLATYLLLSFESDSGKAALSMMNIVLIVIPLVSIIFGTMFVYNSIDFIRMALCQPIDRNSLFIGLFFGNSIPLAVGFFSGTSIACILNGITLALGSNFLLILGVGIALTFIFTSIAFLIAIIFSDKTKGLGFSIIIWLVLAVVYDGIILFIVYFFRDYPVENAVLAISLFNPIDLARILFVLGFDISALMGYTGAIFNKFFGSSLGIILSITMMVIWFIIPILFGLKSFYKKDF
ncbi:MAG: ABC transporter permease [Ignavibacterium sp.]|nr:ABC transporter permease [Ignavibacterium sp.]HCY74751.1 nitrous-oxide metabolic protein NosY [Ignavibacteriales bacterium]